MTSIDSRSRCGDRRDLEAALAAREEELRYLHHWIKNQLQFLSSTTFLAQQQASSPETLLALQACRAREQALGLLHETLYRNPLTAPRGFAACVQNLLDQLLITAGAQARGLSAEVSGDDCPILPTEEMPCLLLINELVTNALQHAFPGGGPGRIGVVLQRGLGGRREILVADDGVGGAGKNGNWLGEGGLGLRLVAGLALQLEARLDRPERQAGTAGTVWRLILGEPEKVSPADVAQARAADHRHVRTVSPGAAS